MSEQADQNALSQGRTFVWHEVYGANSQSIIDFYTQALDFGTMDMPMGEMNYRMLTRNGQPVCGVMGTAEQPGMSEVPPHWATYISVDDVDARLEKCTSLGAKCLMGPFDVPTIGRMALILDPSGATFWLFKGA